MTQDAGSTCGAWQRASLLCRTPAVARACRLYATSSGANAASMVRNVPLSLKEAVGARESNGLSD